MPWNRTDTEYYPVVTRTVRTRERLATPDLEQCRQIENLCAQVRQREVTHAEFFVQVTNVMNTIDSATLLGPIKFLAWLIDLFDATFDDGIAHGLFTECTASVIRREYAAYSDKIQEKGRA